MLRFFNSNYHKSKSIDLNSIQKVVFTKNKYQNADFYWSTPKIIFNIFHNVHKIDHANLNKVFNLCLFFEIVSSTEAQNFSTNNDYLIVLLRVDYQIRQSILNAIQQVALYLIQATYAQGIETQVLITH